MCESDKPDFPDDDRNNDQLNKKIFHLHDRLTTQEIWEELQRKGYNSLFDALYLVIKKLKSESQ
jgi:hypothetical protein